MNILDYLMIGIIIIAGLTGFKKGLLNVIIVFLGTLAVVVFAFYLKNPLSVFLYNKLPLFGIGDFTGMSSYSIMIYEAMSYLITALIISTIVSVIIKITGVFNKLVNATIILGFPSKILGLVAGALEGLLIVFFITFVLNIMIPNSSLVTKSKYKKTVLEDIPYLSEVIENPYKAYKEITDIQKKYKDEDDKTAADLDTLGVLLKYEILTVKNADKLIEEGKIKTEGAKEVVDVYRNRNGE